MFANDLFHPDHVVPAPELVAAPREGTNQFKTEMPVKMHAAAREVLVFGAWPGDAGVEIEDPHLAQPCFQFPVEPAADAGTAQGTIHVDGKFRRP